MHLPIGLVEMVREFYPNLWDIKELQCYVRGKWVSFDRHIINYLYGLGNISDGAKFKRLKKNPGY